MRCIVFLFYDLTAKWPFYDLTTLFDTCAKFHEVVTAVVTAVNRANYGRSYGRNSFMKLGTGVNVINVRNPVFRKKLERFIKQS